ncbi:hypothetical protein KAX02_02740 [candidate division WOR-3 bacterium]|nr:hypothetical protein [candidate division WOR-3 bacterium]
MKKLILLLVLSLFFYGTAFAENKEDIKSAVELTWQLEAKQFQLQNVQLEFRYCQERIKVLQYQAKGLQAEIRVLVKDKEAEKD